MPYHINLCLLQTDRKTHILAVFITPIDLHFHYDSNGGTFVSNGYELLKLFHNYCSQLALQSYLADFGPKKKKRAAPYLL